MSTAKRGAVTYNAYNTVFPSEAGKEDPPALTRSAEKIYRLRQAILTFLGKALDFLEKKYYNS